MKKELYIELANTEAFELPEEQTTLQAKHDEQYKAIFSNKEMVESLLRDFVDERFITGLDFSTLHNCNSEFIIKSSLGKRMSDMVWCVNYNETPCYIAILLEFQSKPDIQMPLRIMAYESLLWQDLANAKQLIDNKYPPILPIVLYNGKQKWNVPLNVSDIIFNTKNDLYACQPSCQYFLLNINDLYEEAVAKPESLMGYVVRLEATKGKTEFLENICLVPKKIRTKEYENVKKLFTQLIENTFDELERKGIKIPKDLDIKEPSMYGTEMLEWYRGVQRENRELGLRDGRELGLRDALRDFIVVRFGDFPITLQSNINSIASNESLQSLTRSAYKASSLEDIAVLVQKILAHQNRNLPVND